MTNPLKIYIIIIPGTLRYLKFAVWSIHQRVDLEVILVSNGLNPLELEELRLFGKTQLGCECVKLPSTSILGHGEALNILLESHQDDWFCFCDSDIISTDHNANDIPLGEDLKALSSCDAMFWGDEPVKGVLGRCNQWPDGSPNLSSFFCIYHTATIKEVKQKYNIGFENIALKYVQSETLKNFLNYKGMMAANRNLDTGKVLTAALEVENKKFLHTKIPSLLHIGGLSSWMLRGDRELLKSQYHLTDTDLNELADKNSWLYNKNALLEQDKSQFFLRRQQRLAAARYCFQLISHYVDQTPKPTVDISNTEFIEKIKKIEHSIMNYYGSYQ